MKSRIIKFKSHQDLSGSLVALESNKDFPFASERVFYIYNIAEKMSRGDHAHYKTKQLLIALNGSCKVKLDNGFKQEIFNLDNPEIGLFQDEMIWGTMYDFSDNCILMIFANSSYDKNDYINEYSQFQAIIKGKL